MVLFVLSIGFLKNILDLLANLLNPLNESSGFLDHRLIRGRLWKEEVQHQWVMAGGTIESPVVTVLDIWETLIPCAGMLRIGHAKDVKNHLIDELSLAISLGVERSGFCELGVQHRLETQPKGAEEPVVSVEDDVLWYPKVNTNSLEDELQSLFFYDILLIGCEDGIFENRSMTRNTQPFPCLVDEKTDM
jgi:hypothetical protein